MSKHPVTAAALAVLLLSACANPKKIDVEQYQSFTEGKTTREEVIAALGNPTGSTFIGKDETLSYTITQIDKRGMIPGYGAVLAMTGGLKSGSQICTFTFNPQKVLTAKTCGSYGI